MTYRMYLCMRGLALHSANASGKALTTRLTIGVLVSLGLGLLATRGLDWHEVWQTIRDLPLHIIALALLVFLLSNLARAYRWRLLFQKDHISIFRLFLIENIGLGLNNLVPVRVASEVTQFTLLTLQDKISRGTALATLGMTRIMDIWSSTLLLALGLLFVPSAGPLAHYAAGGFVFSLLLLALVRFLAWGSRGMPLMERVSLLRIFSASVAELEQEKTLLLASLAVSLSQWVVLGISGWIVAWGMDINLSLAQAVLLLLVTIFVASSIPALPGAIGTFEATMVYIMSVFDVHKDLAFPYALVMHALLFLPPTILAAGLLPREGIGSLRGLLSQARTWTESSPQDDRQGR
ncbi:flippase-like domain-containing protein [SAR202 cluster bacterium AC-647-N09_OGT_505m]|nr:flippase-like domain-containing protein [SAR202 cluster bacterium AC-647-N09_OGT_505m]